MSTRRTPRHRDTRPVVSAAAVEAWQRARAVGYPKPGWQDAEKALARDLGTNWICDMSPLDVTSERAPVYIARNEVLASDYRRAWELRQALIAAEKAMRSKRQAESAANREAEAAK